MQAAVKNMFRASHQYARISSSKVRPFADMIRGRQASAGLEALRYVPNRGARMLEKVLKSAIANAEDRGARGVDMMVIRECRVDDGPMMKRLMPRSRGMACMIQKKFCHIHVGIDRVGGKEAAE